MNFNTELEAIELACDTVHRTRVHARNSRIATAAQTLVAASASRYKYI